jgi:hypothetical protein
MSHKGHATIAIIEGAFGGVLVLAGLALAILMLDWTAAFWIVTIGAACIGHAVTFGFGLLERPFFWSASRGRRPRGH